MSDPPARGAPPPRTPRQPARRAARIGLVVVGTAAILFCANFALGLIYVRVTGLDTSVPFHLDRRNPDYYRWQWPADLASRQGEDWFDDYLVEYARANRAAYWPFVVWRNADFSGKYINVRRGIRLSYRPATLSAHPLRVFFLGNSTTWGLGVRDLHTIASEFARLAEAEGLPVEVTNYAEMGWDSWQDVIFLAELAASGDRPDLVIDLQGPTTELLLRLFASGPLPLLSHYDQRETAQLLDEPDDAQRTLHRYNGVRILLDRIKPTPSDSLIDAPPAQPAILAEALRAYSAAVDLGNRLARSYAFEIMFFLQPCVFSKTLRAGEERLTRKTGFGASMMAFQDAVREPAVIKLDRALDASSHAVMLDPIHWNEEGARLIAEAMLQHARPRLTALLAARPETKP